LHPKGLMSGCLASTRQPAGCLPSGECMLKKLTESQVQQLIREYSQPLPDGEWIGIAPLAKKFGVASATIQHHLEQRGIPPHPPKLYYNEAWLRGQYITNNHTVAEIAAQFGVTPNAILKAMRKAGISRRNASEAHIGRQVGENNPAWKGGVTPERQRLYKNGHWLEFCAEIYARDNYTCQRCGAPKKEPKSLHAHHLKPWGDEPALRFEKSNVITLCRNCHTWVHSKANVNREFLQ